MDGIRHPFCLFDYLGLFPCTVELEFIAAEMLAFPSKNENGSDLKMDIF